MLSNPSFRRSANCGRFDTMLKGRELQCFPIEKMNAKDLKQSWIDSNGLEKPVLIEDATGLGLRLPPTGTKLSDIAAIIGSGHPIKVIAVGEQSEIACTLGTYANYLANRSADHKVLNLISLEVSATRLSGKVQSPSLVREIDWIDKCWPLDRRARGDFPQVQKYCLCGMGGSYTDFHVDFGGTSVWYHVVSGRKRFYLIPPSTANLRAYESWTCSKSQDTIFFGDIVGNKNCYQLDLFAGQTLLIPGAWIHAVYTPQDSLVFGGNFLNSYNIVRQLQVYGIEQRTFVGKIYCFPYFKLVNWFVLCSLLPVAKKIFGSKLASKKDDNNSDSDDDSEDLIALCQSIKTANVFKQFPYLVRTCHFWLLAADDEEHISFSKAAQEAWCDDVFDVINTWWDLLLNLADELSLNIVGSEKGKNSMRLHVERIRDVKVFDMLDKRIVGPAFGESDEVEEGEVGGRGGVGENESDDDSVGVEVKQDEKEKLFIATEALIDRKNLDFQRNVDIREVENQEVLTPLRIKLKLNSTLSVEEEEEKEEEEEEEEDKEDTSSLKFKFQMPSISSLVNKSSGNNISNPNKFNFTIASSSSTSGTQANLLKSRMALQSERIKNAHASSSKNRAGAGLLLDVKRIGIPVPSSKAAAAKRKIRKLEEYEGNAYEDRPSPLISTVSHEFDLSNILPEKEGGGGRYSTRGNRVSAAFLLHAEDVDIRETSGGDDYRDGRKEIVRNLGEGIGRGGLVSLDDESDIPFLFDDDAGDPYGEEDWTAGKSDGDEDEKEDHKIHGDAEDEDDSDEEEDEDEDDDIEYTHPSSKKRFRDSSASTSATAPPSLGRANKPIGRQNQTSRQRLMAKFK